MEEFYKFETNMPRFVQAFINQVRSLFKSERLIKTYK